MTSTLRRFADKSMFGTIPPGVNPFAYILNLITPQYFLPLSKYTLGLLVFFFIVHLLIALFCIVILVLPYLRGRKQSQWFLRRLYIKDRSGTDVYKTTLFWVNGGILMTTSQLVGSVATQTFIFIQIKAAKSLKYAIHAQIEPSLGVLSMCEMLTYWSLMHCFVVAVYYDPETHGVVAKRSRRWTPSPTFINFLFLGFPICLVIAIICLFTWLSIVHNRFIAEAVKVLDALGKGSFVWDQLNAPSASDEQKFQLTTQLLQIVAEAKGLSEDINIHSKHLISCLRHFQCALLMILSVTSLIFIFVFSCLVKKFQQRQRQSDRVSRQSTSFCSWLNLKRFSKTSGEKHHQTNNSLISIARSNRQFFHLVLRAVSIIIAMLTSISLFIIGIVRTGDVVTSSYWRGVMTWLTTVSGTWSAIPVAWQCWTLYREEMGGLPQVSANVAPSTEKPTHQTNVPTKPWDCEAQDRESITSQDNNSIVSCRDSSAMRVQ
ncbi:uncharacterized protein PGTG_01085 [Puccinia graminis f. sp. tritici CRL 75-36-700-3]|uniref:Uncharacterized protein n=1 Tax=Puccinia graminis f. sp. tritici (strain CRL 75-36-700-3 / race SCCL) TaxID=418459 RepID=E3JUM9_PUCGT|nr:uncharacterized protein PGTG_01085 [Puccinia graminis f. sp. tritici CRL 75-36-700-3]EFP75754.2 hypothetical protein PGTG_01085 [Puccinia graminis f. sp. tritici CRL 75-36-700-3]